uniref:Ig-like domain-containing protein n=1 Tax=Neogobius melanostomus TaxID=47308 RepID=A0A8C6WIJ7_9GOBI
MNVKHLPFSTDQPELGLPECYGRYCVTLNKDVITAETGLCAVINCSFSIPSAFNPTSLVWFKCEPGGRCSDFDIIFHSKNKNKIQSSFLGRVSLLEPNLSQRNCSIIINDLQSYKIKITHDALWPVALQQKPTVQTPALTEGQHSALTCTAPGLCSGSEPTFTWTWRGAGDAPPNVTTATTDRLTPVNHRHSSTLWLTASAELHGAELSCTVSYKPSSSSTQDSVRINVTYGPSVEVRVSLPPPYTQGQRLTLTCDVLQSNPPPFSFTWFKDDQKLSTEQETYSKTLQPEDRGSYSCSAQNTVSTARSGPLQIQVQCEFRSGLFSAGRSVVLKCNTDANPPPGTFHWNQNSKYRQNTSENSLELRSVGSADQGCYSCRAKNRIGTGTVSTALCIKVLYGPKEVRVQADTGLTVKENMTLTLRCSAQSDPPVSSVSWSRVTAGQELRVHTGTVYTVKSVSVNDSGLYSCTAHNPISQGTSPPAEVKVKCERVLYIMSGRSVVLKCNTDANPFPFAFYWNQDSKYRQSTSENSLELRSVGSADQGCYSCRANNRIGTGTDSTGLCIKVLYGPKEVRVQADPGLTVKENMTLTLRCSAQSDPPVSSVSWSRVTAGQELHVHTGTIYTVKSVSVNDRGLYSCTAHNPISQGTSPPAEVKVKCEYGWWLCNMDGVFRGLQLSRMNYFIFGPKQAAVLRAEEEQGSDGSRSVTLSCSSHSFPLSLYTWYRSTEGRATKVSENINYTVLSTQPGVYHCTAKNELGQSTSELVSLFQQGQEPQTNFGQSKDDKSPLM